MGISYKVAQWLNSVGHDAVHLSEQGLHTLNDHLIVENAKKDKRVILTADMDFGQIIAFSQNNSVSIFQFRLFDMSPENIIGKLSLIFEDFSHHLTDEPILVTIQERKIRFKKIFG